MESKRLFISLMLYKAKQNKQGLCPVYMRLTMDGIRETVATGVLVDPKQWDENKGQIKGASETAVTQNNLLITLKSRALSIYTELLKANLPVSASIIRQKLLGKDESSLGLMAAVIAHNAYVKKRIGIEVAAATYTKYETLRLKLEAFLSKQYKRKDLLLGELNQRLLVDLELYLKTEEKIGHNTTTKYIQFLKRIVNYAISNEWLNADPFKGYRCKFKSVHRDVLTLQELAQGACLQRLIGLI